MSETSWALRGMRLRGVSIFLRNTLLEINPEFSPPGAKTVAVLTSVRRTPRSRFGTGVLWRAGGLMDAESNDHHRGDPRVVRFTGAKPPARPSSAIHEEEFAGLSTAKFERFLRAANQQDLAPRRRRAALTLLAIGLIALTALTYFLATRESEEDTAATAEAALLKRAVCQAAVGYMRHPEQLEGVCQVHP